MIVAPPHPTRTTQRLITALERLGTLSPAQARRIVAASLIALVVVDHLTGRGVNIIVLYSIVTCFAAWTLGERGAFATAGAICVTFASLPWTRYLHEGGAPPEMWRTLWNAGSRSVAVGLLGLTVSSLRCLLALERWRADTDPLTGALNKRAFHVRMAASVAAARRDGRALILGYMDLDGFKGVNDAHGHSAGDRVLSAFAAEAGAAIRDSDLFARIGGDEFVTLMVVPDCDRGDAVAEMLHSRLSAILRDTGFPVTCSMGALVIDTVEAEPADDFIAVADALMYEVKRSGKDALRIARWMPAGVPLRAAFPPAAEESFDALLARLDGAEALRRAA